MLIKNSGQASVFDQMIFEKLISKDHILVKIDSIVNFSFVYEKVQDTYSHLGRGSKDPEEFHYRNSKIGTISCILRHVTALNQYLSVSI